MSRKKSSPGAFCGILLRKIWVHPICRDHADIIRGEPFEVDAWYEEEHSDGQGVDRRGQSSIRVWTFTEIFPTDEVSLDDPSTQGYCYPVSKVRPVPNICGGVHHWEVEL